jgi:hypothetical protein
MTKRGEEERTVERERLERTFFYKSSNIGIVVK